MDSVSLLGWMAGILDGEGSISVGKRSKRYKRAFYRIKVSIGNTNEECLWIFSRRFGGSVRLVKDSPNKLGHKPFYRWQCTGAKAKELLLELSPYVIIKRQRALLALEFLKTQKLGNKYIGKEIILLRENLRDRISYLNNKGEVYVK